MFLGGPVPVHLKFVVAYRKNLGKCLIFFCSKSPWKPLRFRKHRGDVCSEYVKATPSPLQVSGCAWLSNPQPDSWVSQQILNAFPWVCIVLTPMARLMGLPANIECLSASVEGVKSVLILYIRMCLYQRSVKNETCGKKSIQIAQLILHCAMQ